MASTIPTSNPPKDFIFTGSGPYIYLNPDDILEEGDEYRARGGVWLPTMLRGTCGTWTKYRRPRNKKKKPKSKSLTETVELPVPDWTPHEAFFAGM